MTSHPETQWELSTDAAQAVSDLAAQVQHDLKNPLMVVRLATEGANLEGELKQASTEAMARIATLLAELGRLSNALSAEKDTCSKEELFALLKESIPGLTLDESKPWVGPLPGPAAGVVALILDWCAILGGAPALSCAVGPKGGLVLKPRAGAKPVPLTADPLKLWRFTPGHEGYVPWATALKARAMGLKLRLITKEGSFAALELA